MSIPEPTGPGTVKGGVLKGSSLTVPDPVGYPLGHQAAESYFLFIKASLALINPIHS